MSFRGLAKHKEPPSPPLDLVPLDPRSVYSVPVWRAYRASMVALGLIEGPPQFSLKEVLHDLPVEIGLVTTPAIVTTN
jgi:hypothetical protein